MLLDITMGVEFQTSNVIHSCIRSEKQSEHIIFHPILIFLTVMVTANSLLLEVTVTANSPLMAVTVTANSLLLAVT